MRLWQHADACGKLRYSLIPAAENIAKIEENISVLSVPSLVPIKIEEDEDQPNNQKIRSCDVSNHMNSMMHLYKVAIDAYTCDRCDMRFPMQSMLNRHKIMHNMCSSRLRGRHSKQKYVQHLKIHEYIRRRSGHLKTQKYSEKAKAVCTFCDFNCNRPAILAAHLRKEHKEDEAKTKKISCTICSYECSKQANLSRHMRKHKSKNTTSFACNLCEFECKRSTTLTSHLARNHKKPKKSSSACTKNRKRKITKCNYTSPKKTSPSVCSHNREVKKVALEPHQDSRIVIKEENCIENSSETSANVTDTSKKPDSQKNTQKRCNFCDFTCAKKSTLYSHKRRHKVENVSEVYACNECSFKTGKKSSLYSHIKRKHKEPRACDAQQPTVYYCSQCDYKNKNKYELKVHVARKHSDDFKFSCETCGRKFKVKGDLTNHIRFNHREQPVICDVCGKTCLNSNSLYVHQKFAHYKAKYECQVCKRRMVSQKNLNEHMVSQHERRENVVCEECGKTFSRNSRLKVHMRIHTGDKPYNCTICSKSFARKTALKQHLLIHTGIRPYVCDICGKAFTQKPGLISHRKSHPGSHPPLPRVLIDHILNDVMNA